MPRRPNLIPSQMLHLALPLPVLTQLNLHLYSELEACIPRGAYQRFFVERLREFFSSNQLDLAPFAGTEPGAFVVSGSPEAISVLERTLKGELPL